MNININSFLKKGIECYNNGLYYEAFELFDRIICDNPEQEECYFYAGRCCEKLFYETKAIEYYLKGLEKCIDKEYVSDYQLNIGNCYIMLSEIDKALYYYDAASKYEGNYIKAQFNKAKAFLCIKHYEKAKILFEQVRTEDVHGEVKNDILNKYIGYCKTELAK